jgi:hypothetical protein
MSKSKVQNKFLLANTLTAKDDEFVKSQKPGKMSC